MTDQQVLSDMKKQVINLLDDLSEVFPSETELLMARIYFDTQVDPLTIMQGFEKWVYPWKDKIIARDERFFHENDHIFGPVPANKLIKFKKMYKDGTIDSQDKKVIWDYFNVYIKLIERYKKKMT